MINGIQDIAYLGWRETGSCDGKNLEVDYSSQLFLYNRPQKSQWHKAIGIYLSHTCELTGGTAQLGN